MNLNYTSTAELDLVSIHARIAQDSSRTADTVVSRIRGAVTLLRRFPMLGRTGRVPGTRELSMSGLPYLVVYVLRDEYDIDVLTVLHTRRAYPPTDP